MKGKRNGAVDRPWQHAVKVLVCVWVAGAAGVPNALAQSYPQRPVRIIVPFTPGTGMDIIARIAGPKLSERFGQAVFIDNRPGASGNIGTEAVAKSAPDGLTLMVTANTFVITPVIARTPFDPIRDFAPVAQMATGIMALAVHPSLPVTTVAALIGFAKARPGALNYASPGSGTPQHMAAELFKIETGAVLTHVPYKGSAGAVADVVGGQVPVMFMPMHTALPHVASKRLRVLAQSGRERSANAPEVPTFAQAAVRGVDVGFWFGMLAPAAVPQDIIVKLNAEIAAIWQAPDVREGLKKQGLEPVTGTPAQFAQLIRDDLKKWDRVVKQAKITAD
jgi:tripartite-type tricarboxylate transporter receptor subunit TctC